MKKLSKIISITSGFILSLVFSVQSVYADVIFPGEERRSPNFPNNQNELLVQDVVGGVIVLVVIFSFLFLIFIRKRNVNK